MTPDDLAALEEAVVRLERPRLVARIAAILGKPFEIGMDLLPSKSADQLQKVVQTALSGMMEWAAKTLKDQPGRSPAIRSHKIAVAATGALGGFGGMATIAAELPVSTTIILRSIADIARSEGEKLSEVGTRLACLEVFALGGRSEDDDQSEPAYYALRASLAYALRDAAEHIAKKGLVQEGAPVIARFLAKISSRLSPVVAEKVVAQGVPALGSIGGAVVNLAFIDHFQEVARGHFTVRRLERTSGREEVESEYKRISKRLFGERKDS